jgi:hypothetical protein
LIKNVVALAPRSVMLPSQTVDQAAKGLETKGQAMSCESVLPSSLHLELEAQRMHATAHPARLGETAPALVLSRLPQAFDAFVWAAAAIFVLPHWLFPPGP